MILDFEVSLDERMAALRKSDDLGGVINQLTFMYITSSCRNIGEYLLAISLNAEFDVPLRLSCAQTLVENTNRFINFSEKGFNAVKVLCETEDTNLLYRKGPMMYLMRSAKHKFAAKKYLINILRDEKYAVLGRYTVLLEIENVEISAASKKYFATEGFMFIISKWTNMMYRLMAAQFLLKLNKEPQGKYETYVASTYLFLTNTCFTHAVYNVRADAADILLTSDHPEFVRVGQETIEVLAGRAANYFDNQQNVHIKSIEKSCEANLEILSRSVCVVQDIEVCMSEFRDLFKDDDLSPALERIVCDRSLYTKHNLNLSGIFRRVWSYIRLHEMKTEMAKRLYEELIESVGVCSSGFMARMVNSLSGFDDFGVGIDYADQIAAYFRGRMNAIICALPDNDEVLAEMTEGTGPAVRVILREHLSNLRTDLEKEFADYLDPTDFDLYFKRAYVAYYD